jgi:hypothetical protein
MTRFARADKIAFNPQLRLTVRWQLDCFNAWWLRKSKLYYSEVALRTGEGELQRRVSWWRRLPRRRGSMQAEVFTEAAAVTGNSVSLAATITHDLEKGSCAPRI